MPGRRQKPFHSTRSMHQRRKASAGHCKKAPFRDLTYQSLITSIALNRFSFPFLGHFLKHVPSLLTPLHSLFLWILKHKGSGGALTCSAQWYSDSEACSDSHGIQPASPVLGSASAATMNPTTMCAQLQHSSHSGLEHAGERICIPELTSAQRAKGTSTRDSSMILKQPSA